MRSKDWFISCSDFVPVPSGWLTFHLLFKIFPWLCQPKWYSTKLTNDKVIDPECLDENTSLNHFVLESSPRNSALFGLIHVLLTCLLHLTDKKCLFCTWAHQDPPEHSNNTFVVPKIFVIKSTFQKSELPVWCPGRCSWWILKDLLSLFSATPAKVQGREINDCRSRQAPRTRQKATHVLVSPVDMEKVCPFPKNPREATNK